ncbi:TlpA disulfide reductase family protein [Pedobacter sp. BAL39]|uniref:TlpA disulfide reductase family protein n=1 Tax=Pedobacter sp. BAL39 TaxID=391596 RepID=UPI0012F80833|nr:TlpA disulfide reductase family protein [Pedobacter sp. BAL39]
MKRLCMPLMALLLLAMSTSLSAQQFADFPDIGDDIIPEYPNVEWIKGTPVKAFEKDKIYIVELWATWCKPCIAAMPHLNAMHLRFKDKNVVFIGQDVMESDRSKVDAFVKEMGDGLSYTIAYSGPEGSDFDKKWVKAAGVTGIPQTFIIQNNKLVWQTHPSNLNDEVIQLLVDGKFTIDAAKALIKK